MKEWCNCVARGVNVYTVAGVSGVLLVFAEFIRGSIVELSVNPITWSTFAAFSVILTAALYTGYWCVGTRVKSKRLSCLAVLYACGMIISEFMFFLFQVGHSDTWPQAFILFFALWPFLIVVIGIALYYTLFQQYRVLGMFAGATGMVGTAAHVFVLLLALMNLALLSQAAPAGFFGIYMVTTLGFFTTLFVVGLNLLSFMLMFHLPNQFQKTAHRIRRGKR